MSSTTYEFTTTKPSEVKFSDFDWNKKAVTKVYINPGIALRVGSYEKWATVPWYLNTPFGQGGKPTTAPDFLAKIDQAIKNPGDLGPLTYTLDIRINHDVDDYKKFFGELHNNIADVAKDKVWFDDNAEEITRDNIIFVTQASLRLQRQHEYHFMRVKVVPTGLPNAPTLRMATGKDETGYTWKNITTTDLLSPQDGGNGQLRNAKIIAILEDVGVWARKDPALGVGWRLAQAFIIPSDDRPVSDSRAANRSVDAYSGIFPGDMRFE